MTIKRFINREVRSELQWLFLVNPFDLWPHSSGKLPGRSETTEHLAQKRQEWTPETRSYILVKRNLLSGAHLSLFFFLDSLL